MKKHKHEWEPRLSVPTMGRQSRPYLLCPQCGKKKTLAFKRRAWK